MQYHFKQSVQIQNHDYRRGIHEISEDVEGDPYFLKLVKAQLVVEADAPKIVSAVSQQERTKKLLDRLMGRKPKALKAKSEDEDEEEGFLSASSDDEESEPAPKKKKKKSVKKKSKR